MGTKLSVLWGVGSDGLYHDENPKIQSVMLEINRRVYLNGDAVSEKAVCNIDKIINFIAENLNPNTKPLPNVACKVGYPAAIAQGAV